jgi:hypothetical protein
LNLKSQIKANSRHDTNIIDTISKVFCKPIYRLNMQLGAEMVQSVYYVTGWMAGVQFPGKSEKWFLL